MPKGGKREGAGRKTKAEEAGLPALIEDCIGEEGKRAIIIKINAQAVGGSFLHQQMLMHYMFGKPQDHIDVTSGGEIISIRFKDAE